MSADKAELLGLIGLRALAVRDPFEYRRVADLPIPELDRRIAALLAAVPDRECRRLYNQVIEIGCQPDADILLDEVVTSSFRRAGFEAMELETRTGSSEDANVHEGTDDSESHLSNPGAIIADELERANLKWASQDANDLMPFRFDNEFMVLKSEQGGGNFLDALGSVANTLSDPELVVGEQRSRKSAIWKICESILHSKGMELKAKATQTALLSAAQHGESSDWLRGWTKRADRTSPQQS